MFFAAIIEKYCSHFHRCGRPAIIAGGGGVVVVVVVVVGGAPPAQI